MREAGLVGGLGEVRVLGGVGKGTAFGVREEELGTLRAVTGK